LLETSCNNAITYQNQSLMQYLINQIGWLGIGFALTIMAGIAYGIWYTFKDYKSIPAQPTLYDREAYQSVSDAIDILRQTEKQIEGSRRLRDNIFKGAVHGLIKEQIQQLEQVLTTMTQFEYQYMGAPNNDTFQDYPEHEPHT